MKSKIVAIEYSLPEKVLTNDDLAAEYPDWTVGKISEKTGIDQRYISSEGECSSDLGVRAAEKLFATGVCSPDEIDYVLFCTQSPDYFLPTTACVIQDRLNIPTTAGAIDYNQGCSGFIYGLGLAKGLIETGQAKNILLITAETYSKFIHPGDRSVRTLFGDAGAATFIKADDCLEESIGPFVYGTDGKGAKNLIVPCGGSRSPSIPETALPHREEHDNIRSSDNLYMNGSEIFTFTLSSVPRAVKALLEKSDRTMEDVDLFVFHQANKFMLEHLRTKIKIPEDKFVLAYQNFGNTVSCTIPIALKEAVSSGQLTEGMTVMLIGFGVGYSWGGCSIKW
jgi:3-oxoacyl-[acyl-carrier-protein] synthase-3